MGVHALFSLVLLSIALILVFKLWYPAPLDQAMGVTQVFWVILAIDLILGPLLTFVIFNPKKKELKWDLLIIVLIQLSAYVYGLYTVAQGRPVWQVFVVDDIELVRAIDLDSTSKRKNDNEYQAKLFSQPRWVAAVYSLDPHVASQQKQDEMFGKSLASRPETYQSLQNRSEQIKAKVQNLDNLFKFNAKADVEKKLSAFNNFKIIGFLPVKSLSKDMVVLIGENAQPIAIIDLRPWS
ncbi:TfpX/TfpZ family type IV pilin accessory protein [Acinetobacter silvestris]|nr:TfpX/TfpZ family type IV pilin accessory protein [Acinetobacter silvestris]